MSARSVQISSEAHSEAATFGFRLASVACVLALVVATGLQAQEISGTFNANGNDVSFSHVQALEIDSETEPGYLDILVMFSDRELSEETVRSKEALEKLAHGGKLSGLRLVLDPDCKIKEISPYHSSFTTFLVNADETSWKPSAFDEFVAGNLSGGAEDVFEQSWSYDLTFKAKIKLDPEAQTVGDR